MIKQLSGASIKNRKITLFLIFLIGIFGLYSYIVSPKQQAPDLSAPNVLITTIYPGASPDMIEKQVTKKIEDRVSSVEGFDYSESFSKENVSIVVLFLDQGVDTDKAYAEVRQKMQSLQSDMPQGVQPIDVNTDLTETAGMLISLSGTGYDYEALETEAENLKTALSRIYGISRFEIVGKQEYEMKVEVDLDKLKYYKISLEDISGILASQNIEIPSGSIQDGNQRIDLKIKGYFDSIEDIENTIIAVSRDNGTVARLKDIATVSQELSDSNYKILRNGQEAILLTGYFNQDENVVSVGQEVEKRLEEYKKNIPSGLLLEEVIFQPKDVKRLVNDFTINLIEGIILVILVVFIGMGMKNAIVVSTAIPLSIFITLVCMRFFQIKIHQISITSLIISLGMLVDNAIVVSDSIQNKIDTHMDKLEACLEGVKEVAYPVLTSTLTTVAAFVPLLMLDSTVGKYIRSLPQIIIISLTASYIVAIMVTPMMAYMFFQPTDQKKIKKQRFRKKITDLLSYFLGHRKILAGITLVAIGLTVAMTTGLNMQFFPKDDGNILYMDISSEISSDIANTESLVKSTEELLLKQKEVTEFTTAVGGGLPKYYIALQPYTKSRDFAQIVLRLDLKNSDRFKSNRQMLDFLQKEVDEKISGGKVTVKELEQGYPMGAPITIRVSGSNMEDLSRASEEIQGLLRKIPGSMNVRDDLEPQKYEFVLDINQDKASALGITKYDIQKEIAIALAGRGSSVFRGEGKEYSILVKGNIQTREDIENLFIKSSYTGELVPIREMAQIRLDRRWTQIKKYDREITISIYADSDSSSDPVQIQTQLEKNLKDMNFPGVRIAFDGERERIFENFGEMGMLAVISILLVYGILLFQFRSFVQPLIILISIPLSVIGSIFGLFVLRQPLSFMAVLGIVSLLGIVVNNAIVLIDFINGYRASGHSLQESCEKAVAIRFRPIMLTTTTTVIGLIPLVLSNSDLFRPMAISLMFGLIVSTLLTLIGIPVVYYSIEKKFIRTTEEK